MITDAELTERRAEFVYEAARIAAVAAQAPIVPVPWAEREADFRGQFRAVIERQCGPQRSSSPEELHGSWMQAYIANGWRYGEHYNREERVHPDLVPYGQLGELERDKDAVFVVLCEIARLYIRPVPEVRIAQSGERVEPVSQAGQPNRQYPSPLGEPETTVASPPAAYSLDVAALRERWQAWRDSTSATPDPVTGSYIPALAKKLLIALELGDALLVALEATQRPTVTPG